MPPEHAPAQPEGAITVREAAKGIESLLDDDGQFNPSGEPSRAHPDYEGDDAQPGRDLKGRFTAKDAAPEPEVEPEPEPEGAQIQATAEDDDLPAADTDAAPEESETLEAPTGDADTDDSPIETLADLADALETNVGDLSATLTHTFSAAGEDVTVTLAELETGYQKDADYRRSTAKLAEDRRNFDSESQGKLADLQAQAVNLAQQFGLTEQLVSAEMNTERMKSLRESDPAEWSARREEISGRIALLRQAREQAAVNYTSYMANLQTMTRDREIAALEETGNWGETQRATSRTTLNELGFTDFEVGSVADARIVKAVLELADLRTEVATLRAEKATAETTAQRVKKEIPLVTKPGKQTPGRTRATVDRNRARQLGKRLKASGKVSDAAAIIEEMGIV